LFVKDGSWDIGYTYGEVEVANRERGVDVERMAFAADAVRDTAGLLGTPGGIVCRSTLLAKQGVPMGQLGDLVRGGDVRSSEAGRAAIEQCKPLNIFGVGQQSQEALDYLYAEVGTTDRNEQEQLLGSF